MLSACAAHTAATGKSATGEIADDSQRAMTPSERLGPEGGTGTVGPRLIASLDQAIGPNFSHDGDRFTATVGPGSAIPAGSKLVGRIVDVQPAMAGTMAYAVLAISGIERDGDLELLNARIASVELNESQDGGREVNSTGAPSSEIIGSVIPQSKVPDSDAMDRDPLGRGTVIALGSGAQSHHLSKGSRIVVEMRAAYGREGKNAAGARAVRKLGELSAGRTVKIDDVVVESVIGDVVFWVGKDKTERTLVVMNAPLDIPEKRTVITAGIHVSLEGMVERMPSSAEAPRLWKMVSKREATDLRGHAFYIYATRVRVTAR